MPYETRAGYQYSWVVDPLDGTKARRGTGRRVLRAPPRADAAPQEFIKRNGQFTVNIALLRGNTPIMGVVHTPVTVRHRIPLRCAWPRPLH